MGYDLGRVAPHVAAAANEIGPKFGITNIGGWRANGSVPNSDHPKGLALDLMTLSKTKGEAIAAYAIANAGRLGITYIIHWGRIWHANTGKWTTYSGPSPHIDHVHISFSANGAPGGVVADGNNVVPAALPGSDFAGLATQLNILASRLRDPTAWKRFGLYFGGSILILLGVLAIVLKGNEE